MHFLSVDGLKAGLLVDAHPRTLLWRKSAGSLSLLKEVLCNTKHLICVRSLDVVSTVDIRTYASDSAGLLLNELRKIEIVRFADSIERLVCWLNILLPASTSTRINWDFITPLIHARVLAINQAGDDHFGERAIGRKLKPGTIIWVPIFAHLCDNKLEMDDQNRASTKNEPLSTKERPAVVRRADNGRVDLIAGTSFSGRGAHQIYLPEYLQLLDRNQCEKPAFETGLKICIEPVRLDRTYFYYGGTLERSSMISFAGYLLLDEDHPMNMQNIVGQRSAHGNHQAHEQMDNGSRTHKPARKKVQGRKPANDMDQPQMSMEHSNCRRKS